MVKRSIKRNYIASLTKEDGTITTSIEEMYGELLSFYGNLLGTWREAHGFDAMGINSRPKVSSTKAAFLVDRFTKEDIKDALFDIGNDKSLDGYTSYFFKKAWNLVRDEFCVAVTKFFNIGHLLRKTSSIIALIPKTEHASTVGDFRPISCCNVFYKVITKLLEARPGDILPTIIDKAKLAFVKGRSVVENIHLA